MNFQDKLIPWADTEPGKALAWIWQWERWVGVKHTNKWVIDKWYWGRGI